MPQDRIGRALAREPRPFVGFLFPIYPAYIYSIRIYARPSSSFFFLLPSSASSLLLFPRRATFCLNSLPTRRRARKSAKICFMQLFRARATCAFPACMSTSFYFSSSPLRARAGNHNTLLFADDAQINSDINIEFIGFDSRTFGGWTKKQTHFAYLFCFIFSHA